STCSKGLLHGWAGLQTRFVVGASGSAADLLNSGFRRDFLLVVILNSVPARDDLLVDICHKADNQHCTSS
ncbi:hypothetical protein ATANTOWER_017384, partial [Ataeniobius toweri]|nr:hypothetical protein [Ataeniobius toweri]